jgi:eukaryotic-like serine/threonine-protein kinase
MEKIGEYSIIKELGQGGFGIVYKVSLNGQCFALKTMKKDYLKNASLVKRFEREIKLMNSIRNPLVMYVLNYDLNESHPYFTMPLCNKSLKEMVKNIPYDNQLKYSIEFCEGIKAIHDKGITHRDIKPENAMFLDDHIVISDLGLGRFDIRDSTSITETGQKGCTPGYMPPEYQNDRNAFKNGTKTGDIYMVGKSLYYVFSGGLPVDNVLYDKLEPSIASIIKKCIDDNPRQRYQTVDEIICDLNKYKEAKDAFRINQKSLNDILQDNNDIIYKDIFNYLVNLGYDNNEMSKSLKQIGKLKFSKLLEDNSIDKNALVSSIISCFENHDQQINFEDIDTLAEICEIIMKENCDIQCRYKTFEFIFNISYEYNRWNAMRIIGRILSKETLNDDIAELIYPFLYNNKDKFEEMKGSFESVKLHSKIKEI